MRTIIIAPDSFKNSISAIQVCEIIKQELSNMFPDTLLVSIPVSDGGEGFLEGFEKSFEAERIKLSVCGPDENDTDVIYLKKGKKAYIELAQSSGLQLLPSEKQNPMKTTTYGFGEMIRHALINGCDDFIIGIGGSATNDGGAGMAQALGIKFYNEKGRGITDKLNGSLLREIYHIGKIPSYLSLARFRIACDVINPLLGSQGAVYTYAEQKGASVSDLQVLEENMTHFSKVVSTDSAVDAKNIPGAGAAGGLGYGLATFLGAELVSGSELVLLEIGFRRAVQSADLVITGEGKFDHQSRYGKIVSQVLSISKAVDTPVYGIFGKIDTDSSDFEKTVQLTDFAHEQETIATPDIYIKQAIKRLF